MRDGRVAGIVARQGTSESFEVSAAVTVAADGRHSPLVRRTGRTRPRSRFRPRLFGLKRHLTVPDRDSEPAGTVGLHLVPGGYVGACRVETSLTNLCGLLPESSLKRHRGDLDRLADVVFPANPVLHDLWRSGVPSGEWKTIADVRVQASTPGLPGILYVGDAQGTIDPLGGQGMTMALLGAEVLAPFVTRALAEAGRMRPSSGPSARPGTAGSTAGSRSAGPSITSSSTPGSSTPRRPSRPSPRGCSRSGSTGPETPCRPDASSIDLDDCTAAFLADSKNLITVEDVFREPVARHRE